MISFLASLTVAQACIPSQYVGKNYTIIQIQKDIPLLNVNSVTLNGTVNLESCAVVLSNFDFYPPFAKTYLYGSNDPNINDTTSDGYQISLKEVEASVSRNTSYDLNGVDQMQDIKLIKFYSTEGKLVLGYIQLGDNSTNSSTNAKGSTASHFSFSIVFYLMVLVASVF